MISDKWQLIRRRTGLNLCLLGLQRRMEAFPAFLNCRINMSLRHLMQVWPIEITLCIKCLTNRSKR